MIYLVIGRGFVNFGNWWNVGFADCGLYCVVLDYLDYLICFTYGLLLGTYCLGVCVFVVLFWGFGYV